MADDTDLKLPMNDIEQPLPDQGGDAPQEQRDDRPRDETGKFAAKEAQPRGKPDQEAARRREAQERDDARRERDEIKGKYEGLNKRFEDMSKVLAGEDPAAKPPIDPIAEVKGSLDQINQRFQQQDEARQQEQAWAQVRQHADQDEARFREQQPDFPNAAQHYITSRIAEMQALGYDQQQAEAALTQEAQQLLIHSAQGGRSPAEALYAMAKARGYQPGAAGMTVQQPQRQQMPTGGRSLGTGGGPAGGGLTAQQIANMPDDEYMAFKATPEGQRTIKRVMGGMQ